jgi:signal transduction histidine kinase
MAQRLTQVLARKHLIIAVVFISLSSVGIYLLLQRAIFHELDEHLEHKFVETTKRISQGLISVSNINGFIAGSEEWIEFKEMGEITAEIHQEERFFTTGVDALLDEDQVINFELETHDQFRVMEKVTQINGTWYQVLVVESIVAWEAIVVRVFWAVFISLTLLLSILFYYDNLILKRFFSPLTSTIYKLKKVKSARDVQSDFKMTDFEEINQLHDGLNVMNRQLQKYLNEQKEFIENASHELLTPLTILKQRTESMLSYPDVSREMLQEIATVNQTVARLSRLSQTLLKISKIENQEFQLDDEFTMNELIAAIRDELDMLAERNDMEIECDISPCRFFGNRSLFQAMIYNLIKNALLYAKEESSVLISGKKSSAGYQLSIEDEGSGFPDWVMTSQSKRFIRSSQKHDSHGLGLSIAQAIADLHGIRLELFNTSRGANVTLYIPESIIAP